MIGFPTRPSLYPVKGQEMSTLRMKGYGLNEAWFPYTVKLHVSVLLILAILANGIKTLILIPANINIQSRGCT